MQGGCSPRADAGQDAPPPVTTCSSTQDCLAVHGPNWVCRASDHSCLNLASQDCAQVVGSYQSDDAIFFGALLPLFGPHASTGAGLADAVKLATLDFASGWSRSYDGGTSRPIAVVICDENEDADRAARHLRDDIRVPAIIGTGVSESTLRVAVDVTNPGGQLLISPRATASLDSVSGKALVWRTCPSDQLEGAAMAGAMHTVVEPALNQQGVAKVRVAVLHATDPESSEIAAKIGATLILNGAPATDPSNAGQVLDVDYGDPDAFNAGDPTAKYTDAIHQVTVPSALPDAILFVGTTQGVTNVLAGVETNWPASAPRRPRYVVSSAAQVKELLTLVGTNDALRVRILGTAPGSDPNAYANFGKFIVRYRGIFADGSLPETFGVAQAYDAFFVLAYGVSVVRNTDIIGTDVQAALRQILAPTNAVPVDVGPSGISAAQAALTGGKTIALRGVSAPLAFDLTTGDMVSDVQVWCLLKGQGAVPAFQFSGLSYVGSSSQPAGSYGGGCP